MCNEKLEKPIAEDKSSDKVESRNREVDLIALLQQQISVLKNELVNQTNTMRNAEEQVKKCNNNIAFINGKVSVYEELIKLFSDNTIDFVVNR